MALSPELMSHCADKIAASRIFRFAARQRNFLLYVVGEALQGRADQLKEYSIGTAVFGKQSSFDPRVDSIVRTEAHKLRARLTRYFDGEGANDSIRIELPLGQYAPVFSEGRGTEKAGARPAGSAVRKSPALRIVVLPFENHSASRGDEFFSDGLTDELSHAFSNIQGLEVVARTSAFQYKGRPVQVQEVGRQLNVLAVIEGSVRRAGHRLRILAQLDDAVGGRTLWSQMYDRRLTNMFDVQQEIAGTIAGELTNRFRLGNAVHALADGQRQLGAPHNSSAYQDYLQGIYFWNRHTLEDFAASIRLFERAVEQDASFTRAYTSLAYACVMLPMLKAVLPSEYIPRARLAASKALEINPSAGEAHIALALPLIHDFRWREAGERFRQGLELAPSDVVGHAWYGTYLTSIGRGKEGLREHQRVLDLDPVSPAASFCYGQTLYHLGRRDEAVRYFRKAVALDSAFPRGHAALGLALVQQGAYLRGVAELERAQALTAHLGRVKASLGYAYARAGKTDMARTILGELLQRFTPASFPALMIAEIFIGLGNKEEAFAWLHKAIDQKDLAAFLKCDPLYDPLRSDPRFDALLKRMNLAE